MATILLNEGTAIQVGETAAELKQKIIDEKKAGEPNANYIKLTAHIKKPHPSDLSIYTDIATSIELNTKRILYFY